jgi:hypothetical protein
MTSQQVNLLSNVKGYYVGAKAAIESLPGVPEGSLGYATDTNEPGSYDGTTWTWGGGGGVTDHGALTGLSDDDHPQYQLKSLLTNIGDMIYATSSGVWARVVPNNTLTRKFLRQVADAFGVPGSPTWDTLLSADIPDLSAIYAVVAKGVTGGDSHDHNGGDGAPIAYSSLSGALTQGGNSYTPTAVTVANLDSASIPAPWFYIRINNIVMATGQVTCDPTTLGLTTDVRVTLPVASNFSSANDCQGGGGVQGTDDVCTVLADTTNKEALIRFTANTTSATVPRVWMMYEIK